MATELVEDDDQQHPGGFDDETMRMLSANLPDKIFRAPDPRIQMAAIEAERTHQMTPVLKEELRLRILAKRMERGEPDIETRHTPKTYELTEEEKMKRERRKEQNRRAAKKCREKRKLKNLDVAEKFDSFRDENDKLSKEIYRIQKQREQLMEYIQEHILSGHCKLRSSQTNAIATSKRCARSNQQVSTQLQSLSHSSKLLTISTTNSSSLPISTVPSNRKLSNLYLTISPTHDRSQQSINKSTHNNKSTVCQALKFSTNQCEQGNPDIANLLRSHQSVSPSQLSTITTPTSTVTISSTANQPSIIRPQQNHLNQQHKQPHTQRLCDFHYNLNSTAFNNQLSSAIPSTSNQLPSPSMSRTASTTPFPQTQSPTNNQQQSSSFTLTPPPSVSSEQFFILESPSVLTSLTTATTNLSDVSTDLMIQCRTPASDHHNNILTPPILYQQYHSGIGLSYQLSPAESLTGKSTPDFNIMNDKMFDDDDDENVDKNDFTHILNTLE